MQQKATLTRREFNEDYNKNKKRQQMLEKQKGIQIENIVGK